MYSNLMNNCFKKNKINKNMINKQNNILKFNKFKK